jgi:N-acetylmuramoyl-L-alanine amidase
MQVVCLDPGHGGADPGALGPSGLKESGMALDVCLRAQKLLAPHVRCHLTRSTDVFIRLSDRPKISNKLNADVFVSYHFNSAGVSVPNSWEIFTTPGQNNSDRLASAIGTQHAKQFPGQKARADYSDRDIDKEANFTVLRGTDCPSCLMEGEFIHTRHGEELIGVAGNRQKMAIAVMRGVLNFLGIHVVEDTPTPLVGVKDSTLTLEERLLRLEKLHPELTS